MIDPNLPLVDIHRHLDGNIRPSTIWQLAHQNGIKLPSDTFDNFLPHVQIQKSEPDLMAFLSKLDWGVKVLTSLDDVKRIAYENVEDAFNAKIDYAELRFSPYYMAMSHQLPIEGVVEAVIDGIAQGIKSFDVKINLIGIMSRTFGVEACARELDAILTGKANIVAVDLAGDEFNKPGSMFLEHFKRARNADMQITVHAGEAAGSESVKQAITELGATRIGHGVACQHDEALMGFMKNNNIAIESCLTSNYQTGTITNLTDHPVKIFLEKELLVCLNTDDPAVENIELLHEFELAKNIVSLTPEQISRLQRNAVSASFLSDSEKQALLNKTRFNHQL